MGNVQCTTPMTVCQDQPEETTTMFRALPFPSDVGSSSEKPSRGEFLRVHYEDRPEKCIIDHSDVVDALVEQSLELIRRDNDDASLFSGSSKGMSEQNAFSYSSIYEASELSRKNTSFATAFSEATIGGRSSVYSASEVAYSTVTAGTTDTRETRVMRNNKHYEDSHRKRRQIQSKKSAAPKVLGKEFHENAQLQQDLQKAISKVSKKESDAKRLGRLVKAIQGGEGCTMLPVALIQDPIPAHFGARAREHMTILHLRIKPRFVDFYQSHLSRLLPDSPFTRAVTESICLNRMTPPRSTTASPTPQDFYQPPLARTNSDSSDSNSVDAVDFGQEGPPCQPVRLLATGSNFADLGITGSLGLVDRRKAHANHPGKIKPPNHYTVLLNRRSGVPLAVCALKTATTGPPVVRIYVTKRRLYGQRPAASTKKLGLDWCESYPLYPWAELVTEGRYPNRVRYSIFLAKGNDGRFEESPSYLAEHTSVGSPEIRVVGKTERDTEHAGCAILSLCREEGVVEEDDLFMNLSVSKGIDPALLLCFAAIVDEAMEKTMRQQFAALSEGVYRRS